MYIAFKVAYYNKLVVNLFANGHNLVEVEQVGTKIYVVALADLSFFIKQTAHYADGQQ